MGENTGKTLANRLTLRWLNERYMEACYGAREPDILVMGVSFHTAYFELLTGRKDEFYARAKFHGAEVRCSNSIGEWDVVFGFVSTCGGEINGKV